MDDNSSRQNRRTIRSCGQWGFTRQIEFSTLRQHPDSTWSPSPTLLPQTQSIRPFILWTIESNCSQIGIELELLVSTLNGYHSDPKAPWFSGGLSVT
jgi:hypothetical protein